jgi:endonuclease YncB( thermonuclease family)
MGNIFRSRQFRRGAPRKLPKPNFPHERRANAGLRRFAGFLAFAVLIAASGRYLTDPPRSGKGDIPRTKTRSEATRPRAEATRLRITSGRQATVTDGDSLRIGNVRIRLDGIDALELDQTCRTADGGQWSCGRAARERLAELVSGHEVICSERGHDRYGRVLAVCAAGAIRNLGEAMVLGGHAVNYDRYTDRYSTAQAHARAIRRGVWSGTFESPEDWRRRNPRRATIGSSP